MASQEPKQNLAADLWRLMTDVILGNQAVIAHRFEQFGLTPGHLRALLALDDQPRPMRWLADHFSVDPSTVTWMVDRLEQRGLAVRQPLSTDRRVKAIVLTRRGQQTKAKVEAMMYEPPAELVALPATTLGDLHEAFVKLRAAQ